MPHRKKARRRYLIEQLESRLVLDSTVVFSELMYNPAGADESLEWLELHNQMAVNVDLSGWQLEDGVDYTFPEGTVIQGGAYLIVAADVDALAAETGLTEILGPYRGNLSNGGERLHLRNHTGRLMNAVEYGDWGDWSVVADGSGASLAKEYAQAASENASNWRASEQVGGTPARANFGDDGNLEQTLIVPLDSTWKYEQSGTDLGTGWKEPGFNDATWDQGPSLLFVESSALPGPKNTQLNLGQSTYYFRQQFEFNGDAANALLQLNYIVDDGAVFYLNGQEVARVRMPDGTIAFSTLADGVTNAALESSPRFDAGVLKQGTNTLAVEVHQASLTSSDIVLGLELVLLRDLSAVDDQHHVSFSESAGLNGNEYWLELHNSGVTDANLKGFEIVRSDGGQPYVISDLVVPAGGFLVIDESQLGWRPTMDERVFLYTPNRVSVIDGIGAESRPRARAIEVDNRWQTPAAPTPGAPNTFALHHDIVINEIMYHARPTYATPSRVVSNVALDFDHTWRFEQSGRDLGTAWRETQFDDREWSEGPGLFYFENSELPGPKSTELELGHNTHYFRTTFDVADPSNANFALQHVVDDGAVFYLNGVEIERFNLPTGEIGFDTLAATTIRNATLENGVALPPNLLLAGTNVLAAEVHQTFNNADVVFGARLTTEATVVAGTEFSESAEEWIELYNRGSREIDLSNWSLIGGVEFAFDQPALLGPGQFAVIANDAVQFSAKHPGIEIWGEFSGTLSNAGERIQLLDAVGNIADEVRYFDDGRWDAAADGNGSSLELRDPFANNASAEAWSASDESSRSEWHRVAYRKVAESIPYDPPINFHEFVMGLLAQGEVLVDNISVKSAAGVELMQNGTFEGDRVGDEPDKWRIQGTHENSQVIVDPDDPSNQVLQLVAEARMNYLGNHAETTLARGARVIDGIEYEISYDAKWISGSPQLHTELYYEDAAATTILTQPVISGTPGAVNSTVVSNLGPTYESLSHWPVVPSSQDAVTIRVQPHDPDGLANMSVLYSVNGGSFRSVAMTLTDDGSYTAEIPPQSNGRTVQFYVSGTDARGATTAFPADGNESRALYQVDNAFSRDPMRHDFQIIMIPRDAAELHVNTNILDNDRVGSTVIYNGSEVFYNTGTRLRGSMFSRGNRSSTGYNVQFNADQLFRGVHESIGLDQGGEREIVAKFTTLQTGNLGGTYDDVFNLETPSGAGGGPTLVYLARHQDLFLDEQFENGSNGTLFKFEGIRVMTSTVDGNPESRKIYQPVGWVSNFDIEDLGDDKEKYRWPYLINNNRKQDDYSRLIEMAQAFSAPSSRLQSEARAVLDVDNVTHTFALMSLLGINDTYSQGNPHNLNIYVRPSDNKVLMFPWDWDFTFNLPTNAALHGGKNIGRILDQPHFEHFLLGHMDHMIETRFNRAYMRPWTSHFGEMLGDNYDQFLSRIRDRGNFVKNQLPAQVPFEITRTASRATTVTVSGQGWVNVKELRLAPDADPLDVEWTSATTWSARIPLVPGLNEVTLMAYDFGGELIGSEQFQVDSVAPRPVNEFLRISEINYHPAPPTSSEIAAGVTDDNAFEFIELVNTSRGEAAQTLDLGGVSLSNGVAFTFPPGASLNAGQRVVVVSDLVGFRARYGAVPVVAGEFDLQLSNQGERITLSDSVGIPIVSIEYADKGLWPEAADGVGATLEMIDETVSPEFADKYYHWQASVEFGGSPGRLGRAHSGVVISEVRAAQVDAVELFNSSPRAVDISGWYLSDSQNQLLDTRIADGTVLAPGEYLVLDQRQLGFGLSQFGDDVWLVAPSTDGLQFIDEFHFDATTAGQSFGLTERSGGRLVPLTRNGFGGGNGQPRVGDTIISTINYFPSEPSAAALALDPTITSKDLEYIAINGRVEKGWRLSQGIEFEFPFGLTSYGNDWIISFDPENAANAARLAAFKAHYGITDNGAPGLIGGFQGSLNNSGEQILLQQPIEDDVYQTMDEVIYDDQGDWPVPRAGDPIVRRASMYFGNDGRSWTYASELTSGSIVRGDFNGDDVVNQTDIDLLIDAVNLGSQNGDYVLSGTVPVPNRFEVPFFLEEFWSTQYGDTNLDGVVDDADVHHSGVRFGGWREGDFNGDNMVDEADLALADIVPFRYDFGLFLQLSANFGKTVPSRAAGDLDGDTRVGFSDFLILAARFGSAD